MKFAFQRGWIWGQKYHHYRPRLQIWKKGIDIRLTLAHRIPHIGMWKHAGSCSVFAVSGKEPSVEDMDPGERRSRLCHRPTGICQVIELFCTSISLSVKRGSKEYWPHAIFAEMKWINVPKCSRYKTLQRCWPILCTISAMDQLQSVLLFSLLPPESTQPFPIPAGFRRPSEQPISTSSPSPSTSSLSLGSFQRWPRSIAVQNRTVGKRRRGLSSPSPSALFPPWSRALGWVDERERKTEQKPREKGSRLHGSASPPSLCDPYLPSPLILHVDGLPHPRRSSLGLEPGGSQFLWELQER